MGDLGGRVALVTGAGGGIGSAIAARLAADGAQVVALDRAFPRDGPEDGGFAGAFRPAGAVRSVIADLTEEGAAARAVDAVLADTGRIDILVNCAGLMRRGDALTITPEDWRASFAVNTDAVYTMCRLVLPPMARHGGGSIINIASQWGLSPTRGHVAYNSSKAAVVALSRSLARDHGSQGIRVNAICPGEILTPMVAQKLADTGTTEAELAASIPLGRLGRPEDVAALAAFLAGDDAAFISGAALEITGAQEVP